MNPLVVTGADKIEIVTVQGPREFARLTMRDVANIAAKIDAPAEDKPYIGLSEVLRWARTPAGILHVLTVSANKIDAKAGDVDKMFDSWHAMVMAADAVVTFSTIGDVATKAEESSADPLEATPTGGSSPPS